jgi:transposase
MTLETGRHPNSLPEGLEEYVKRWPNLRVANGVVCFLDRAVVPRSLREQVLGLLHMNHFGETKMKRLARQFFWWPMMDEDITVSCRSCQPCALVNRAPNQAPVIPWSVPHRPWSRVHLDFFEVGRGQRFIVAADGLSGWTDAEEVKGLGAKEAIAYCRRLFRFQGLSDVIVADNGPAFRAEEFKTFCKVNGVELIFSPPYSPASNGVAERAVQTVKHFLKKTPPECWSTQLDSFLLGHNSTPRANGIAPSEYNLGRRPQTLLEKIHPGNAVVGKQVHRDRQAAQAVTGSTRVPVPGQPVTLRTHTNPNQKWAPGQLVKVLGPRRVQIRTNDGVLVERHTDQVKLHPPAPPSVNIPVIQTDPPMVPRVRPVRTAGRPKRLQD